MVHAATPDVGEALKLQTVFARFGELALKSDDLDQILTEACRLAGEALGTDLAKVVQLQEDGQTMLVRAGVGWAIAAMHAWGRKVRAPQGKVPGNAWAA